MKMHKALNILFGLILPLAFLPSCSSNAHNSLSKELNEIEYNSLNQQEFYITQTSKTRVVGESDSGEEAIEYYGKFHYGDFTCYSHLEDLDNGFNNRKYLVDYQIGDWGYKFDYVSGTKIYDDQDLESLKVYYLSEDQKEFHFFYNSYSQKINDLLNKPASYDIKKRKNNNQTIYQLTIKDFISIFNTIVDDQFSSSQLDNDLKLPEKIVLDYYITDGLIKNVKSSFTYSMQETNFEIDFVMDFSYLNEEVLPGFITNKISDNDFNSKLLNGETDFVKEIDVSRSGQLPEVASDIFMSSSDNVSFYQVREFQDGFMLGLEYDNNNHLILRTKDSSQIIVYDATTLKELYTVIFHRKINSFSCCEGFALVSLEIIPTELHTATRYYDLDDFKPLDLIAEDGQLCANQHIVYKSFNNESFSIKAYDAKTKAFNTLYEIKTDTPLSVYDKTGIFYDSNHKVLFVYTINNPIHYLGINMMNLETVYERDTTAFSVVFSPLWTGDGLTFDGSEKIIDAATGEVITYYPNNEYSYNYVLEGEYASYNKIIWLKTLSDKYDIIAISKYTDMGDGTYMVSDEIYAVYNKENDTVDAVFVMGLAISPISEGSPYLINDEVIVCFNILYPVFVLIRLN